MDEDYPHHDTLPPMVDQLSPELQEQFRHFLATSWWAKDDFLVSLGLGIASLIVSFVGLLYSKWSYKAAENAGKAANRAAKAVKIHSDAIELTQLLHSLNKLVDTISYSDARALLSEISTRLKRIIAARDGEPKIKDFVAPIRSTLAQAWESLRSVRPDGTAVEQETSATVYYALESPFSQLGDQLAELCGLLDKKTLAMGNTNGDL